MFYGYCMNNFDGEPSLMFFLHQSSYGTLDQVLEAERNHKFIPNFTSTTKYKILLGISLGLKYSHSFGQINCDLSTNNIQFDENFMPRMLKLSFIPQIKLQKIDPIYIAPEIKNGQKNSYKSDVYSFSMIAYELFSGQKPICNKKKKRPDLSKIKNEIIKNFISKSWSENPQERPNFCEIVDFLMKNEIKKFFNVNEEEVSKFLDLYEDELKNPNLFKPLDIDAQINEKNADDEMFKRGIKLENKKEDTKESTKMFKLAADKGNVNSMIQIANFYIDNDINQSVHYLKMAVEHGNIEAMYYYGCLLTDKLNDPEEGSKYLKMAADNGCIFANNHYALYLLEKEGIKNKKNAAKYLKKAAKFGETQAMLNYGEMLFHGDGIKMNKKKGIEYIKKSADLGNVHAMERYVCLFVHLNSRNKQKAADLFVNEDVIRYQEMAIKTGIPDKYLRYAELFKFGWATPVDKEKAAFYMKLSADKGCVQAMFEYGIMCRDADCVKENKKEAAHYLKMAADNGHDIAMKDYASMLFEGDGIEKNDKEALKYMIMSANNGNVSALMMLK